MYEQDKETKQRLSDRLRLQGLVWGFGVNQERGTTDYAEVDRWNGVARSLKGCPCRFGSKRNAANHLVMIRVDEEAANARRKHFADRMALADALKELGSEEDYGPVQRCRAAGRLMADMGVVS